MVLQGHCQSWSCCWMVYQVWVVMMTGHHKRSHSCTKTCKQKNTTNGPAGLVSDNESILVFRPRSRELLSIHILRTLNLTIKTIFWFLFETDNYHNTIYNAAYIYIINSHTLYITIQNNTATGHLNYQHFTIPIANLQGQRHRDNGNPLSQHRHRQLLDAMSHWNSGLLLQQETMGYDCQ